MDEFCPSICRQISRKGNFYHFPESEDGNSPFNRTYSHIYNIDTTRI